MKEKNEDTIHVTVRFLNSGSYHTVISKKINSLIEKEAARNSTLKSRYLIEIIKNYLVRTRNLKRNRFDIEKKMLLDMNGWWKKKSPKEKGNRKSPPVEPYLRRLFEKYFEVKHGWYMSKM